MFIIILTIFALTILVPDLYICLVVLRKLAWWWSVIAVFPTAAMLVVLGLYMRGIIHNNVPFYLFLGLTFPKIVYTIISIIGLIFSFIWKGAFLPTNIIALVAGLFVLFEILFGSTIGWHRLFVNEHRIEFENLPRAFDGYKIAHISDLHLGTYGNDVDYIHNLVKQINEQEPNIIIFTGDIVNNSSDELRPYIDELSSLTAPDGVYSILGNHDYCQYGGNDKKTSIEQHERVKQIERAMGWNLLINERTHIVHNDDSIAVIGVENYGGNHFQKYGKLESAIEGIPEREFKILLTHDPSHWHLQVVPLTNIDLTLSGHTHAAQLKIGSFSPSKWFFKEWEGLYREGNQVLFVSTGVGGTIPFRLGAWPSIDIIELKVK